MLEQSTNPTQPLRSLQVPSSSFLVNAKQSRPLIHANRHRPSPAPMRGIVVPAMPCDLLMKENSNQDVGDDIATALDHKSPIVIDQQMLSDSGGEQLQRTVVCALEFALKRQLLMALLLTAGC